MRTKELCYPPLKLSVDIKPSIPLPGIIELSEDEPNATPPLETTEPVQVSQIVYQQPDEDVNNSKWDDATDQLQHLPESVFNLLTCIDPPTFYGFPNGQSPPPLSPNIGLSPPHSPIMQDFYSVVRVISEYQSKHYSMLLPSTFSSLAFPSRPDFVRVRELHKPPIIMKLRWRSLRSSEAFLTRGWRKFSVDHGLKCGSVVHFCVPINDETTIIVSILRI
ncbi:hypothetical protein HN51_019139 [Arachis hypogaea]